MAFLFGRGRAATNRKIIDRLNADVVAAVRQPIFYEAGGVPDSFEGRFELLVLHMALVVRRLRALGEPGPTAAHDLIDTMFRHLDPALRELGVGDLAVPKRMKRLAEAFLGRSLAYHQALSAPEGDDALAEALCRNIYAAARPAAGLAAYVRAAARHLDALELPDFLERPLRFPDPVAFVAQDVPT